MFPSKDRHEYIFFCYMILLKCYIFFTCYCLFTGQVITYNTFGKSCNNSTGDACNFEQFKNLS